MKAVILAGGRGVQLPPYTTFVPTPLVPLGDEITMVDLLLSQLSLQGFDEVFLSIGHMDHLVRSFVGDGSRWSVHLTCWDASGSDGAMTPLMDHLDDLPETFLVVNADVLSNLDMGALLREHVGSGAGLTIATSARTVTIDFDVLDIDAGRLKGLRERPDHRVEVAMGVYGFSRSLIVGREVGPLGFDDLLDEMISAGDHPLVRPFDGYFLDISRAEDYLRANQEYASIRFAILVPQAPATSDDAILDLTTERDAHGRGEDARLLAEVRAG